MPNRNRLRAGDMSADGAGGADGVGRKPFGRIPAGQILSIAPQPIPKDASGFVVMLAGGKPYTIILRLWELGDPERCGLCPGGPCVALGGVCCTIAAPGIIPEKDWKLYSTGDRPRKFT